MTLSWTPESLAETVWALNRLLELVSESDPIALSPAAHAYRDRVQQWLDQTKPLLDERSESETPIETPDFPLSGPELQSLEEEIHHVVSERATHEKGRKQGQATEKWKLAISLNASLEHLHTTLERAGRSSYFVIEALAILFLLNAAGLVLVIALQQSVVLTTRLVALALALNLLCLVAIAGLWRLHQLRLQQHREGLGWHLIHHAV